jgi:hypothetical protein
MIFILGRGLRKFNNSLLYEMDYVEIATETNNKKPKEQYTGLFYDRSTLSEIDDLVIHFTINDQLLLETLLTEIRGKTISYASFRKKRNKKLENCLVEDIMKLENELHTVENFDVIKKKEI